MKTVIKLFVVLFFLATSCEVEHTVPVKPEAAVVVRTSPPFENGAWIENEYRWDGNTYVVVPAHWERAKGAWIPGHWKSTRKGYVWIPGHWR
jgi:hypothetical protein